MPSQASKKGTGAKNSSARERRSMSRHSTPLSSTLDDPTPTTPPPALPHATLPEETAYVKAPTVALVSNDPSIETLIERSANHASTPALAKGDYPSAKELHGLHDQIRDSVNKFMIRRGEWCDRSMRRLAQKRKDRIKIEQDEEEQRQAEAAAVVARAKREEDDRSHHREKRDKNKLSRKRSHDEMDVDDEGSSEDKEKKQNLPSVGAHGVARQDGVGVHEGAQAPPSPPVQPGTVPAEPMDDAPSPSNTEASESDQPSAVPLYERTFGKDPTQFDDPTIYDIKDVHDDMTAAEKQAIYNVAQWPESDLHDLTAGDPPDADFSNAKPANQINFSTFSTFVEPYIRHFTEEDVAFLKERGDRTTPYIIPARGQRGFREVWASEDGMDGIAPPRKQESDPNEARGSMEDMNDDTAETDEVSMGPIMNRLMSTFRVNPNGARKDANANGNGDDADGDTSMVNGSDLLPTASNPASAVPGAVTVNGDLTANGAITADQTGIAAEEQKPTTHLPPEAPRPTNLPTLDYETLDQRAIQELRYLGIIDSAETPAFDTHDDDEVAARLRTLQEALRRVSRTNNVRRARVLELTEERMAMQEYATIADDLDGQVNTAYLKRNRGMAKPNSKKSGGGSRPGAGGTKGIAGLAGGRGVSEGVRALMQKRRDWVDMVGPVVGYGRPPIPGDDATIFDEASLKRLEKVEREAEAGEVEGE